MHPGIPVISRGLRLVLLAGALAACGEPAGPGELVASLAIAPVMAPGTIPNALSIDNVRLRLFRTAAAKVIDTVVGFPADSNRISVVLRVPLKARSEKLVLVVELRSGSQTYYSATETVALFAEAQGPTPTPHPIVSYVGPGASARTLLITPRDTVITFGDSFTFRVSAADATGGTVSDPLLLWSTLPALPISSTGTLVAPSTRGTVRLRVFTPAGVGDSTPVRFAPPPAALALLNGGGQSARVGTVLPNPFVVQVRGSDGLGVPGVTVHFRAVTAGGAVRDAVVVSDDFGVAGTLLTLGNTVGPYLFEASVTGIPVLVVNANALP